MADSPPPDNFARDVMRLAEECIRRRAEKLRKQKETADKRKRAESKKLASQSSSTLEKEDQPQRICSQKQFDPAAAVEYAGRFYAAWPPSA
jgi:hypothetical protein